MKKSEEQTGASNGLSVFSIYDRFFIELRRNVM